MVPLPPTRCRRKRATQQVKREEDVRRVRFSPPLLASREVSSPPVGHTACKSSFLVPSGGGGEGSSSLTLGGNARWLNGSPSGRGDAGGGGGGGMGHQERGGGVHGGGGGVGGNDDGVGVERGRGESENVRSCSVAVLRGRILVVLWLCGKCVQSSQCVLFAMYPCVGTI